MSASTAVLHAGALQHEPRASDAAPMPHPGKWTTTVHVVVGPGGAVHWVGSWAAAAVLMQRECKGSRIVTVETGTAYLEGR